MIETYKMTEMISKLLRKGTPLAVAQYMHPGDSFLFTVLIYAGTNFEFVVWTFNAQTGGFSNGSYFCCMEGCRMNASFDSQSHRCKQDAFKEFSRRVLEDI
jgi:hypothetical protein